MANDDWTAPTTRATDYVVTAAVWNEDLVDNLTALFNALAGDAQATGEIIQRGLGGTLANIPAAGTVNRRYWATDLGAELRDNGSIWLPTSNFDPYVCDRSYDEFAAQHGADLTASGWIAGWRVTFGTSNGTADCPDAGRSQLEVVTGGTINSTAHLTPRGQGESLLNPANNLPLIWAGAVRLFHSTNVSYHMGVVDSLSAAATPAPNSSIMFRVIDGGNYITVTQDNGGGETTNDTGVAPDHGHQDHLMIIVYSSSLAEFYINGTKTGTNHTTGIPQNENLHPGYGSKCTAASAKTFLVDMNDLLSKRYYS